MTTINATSWNGTAFVYNRARDTWEMSDNVTIGRDHGATEADMENAGECAAREKMIVAGSITLDEYEAA